MGSGGGDEFVYSPAETARNTTGVVALEWTRDGVTVLAFRGSLTMGDVGNIENWFLDYVIERSTARMKQAWTADAGLTWTDTMQERHDRGDLFARTAIRAQSFYMDGSPNSGKFAPELAAAVRESADSSLASLGLDEAAAKATGYWALTKKMVDDVVDALPTGQVGATQQTISIVCACCILPATYCLPLNVYRPPARRCCSQATHKEQRAHNTPRCTSPRAATPSTPQSRLRPRAARARRGSCVRLSHSYSIPSPLSPLPQF